MSQNYPISPIELLKSKFYRLFQDVRSNDEIAELIDALFIEHTRVKEAESRESGNDVSEKFEYCAECGQDVDNCECDFLID